MHTSWSVVKEQVPGVHMYIRELKSLMLFVNWSRKLELDSAAAVT